MNRPMGKFALSSTPGCGKTTANNFIFKMASSEPFLHQKPILYQLEETFYHFRFDYVYIVDRMTAERIACRRDTFYVIDGNNAKPVHSKCLSLFISSPLNNTFKDWHYEAKVSPWYFPVWSLEELHNCRAYCYPNISVQDALLRYKKYGGVARYVFCTDEKLPGIECAVADSDARKSLWSAGQPSQKFPMSHMLLHISVDTTLRFEHIILASRYVGRELFSKFFSETFELLKLLLGGRGALAGHLFECYVHFLFENGQGEQLVCRSLQGVLLCYAFKFNCSLRQIFDFSFVSRQMASR